MTAPDSGSSTRPQAGSTAADTAGIRMPEGHQEDARVNYGAPPEYPTYDVADQAPLVNPSGGVQGPTEQGANDVNPQGPGPNPVLGAPRSTEQAPDNPAQRGTTGY